MSQKRSAILAVLLLLSTLSGCGHYRHYGHSSRGGIGVALFAGAVVGAALASSSRDEPRDDRPQVIAQTVYVNTAPPVAAPSPASPRDRVPDDPSLPAFDPIAARAAVSAIDVSACRDAGAPAGYGHARITFNPDGIVTMVVVDEPAGMTSEAAKCVGDKLGTSRVPRYRGSLVTMGAVWHVQ